jgi:putative ABC transport system substrate-binding protein
MAAVPFRPRRRRLLAAGLQATALACLPGTAARAASAPRVAFIAAAAPAAIAVRTEAFRRGLRERGLVEGRSVVVDYLYADERLDRIPALVAQALAAPAAVIVSAGPSVTRAARAATTTVPIVMAFDPDPVGAGFVASLAKPGGNVTGMSSVGAEMGRKQLELLQQTLPGLARVVVIGNDAEPGNGIAMRALADAAPRLGISLATTSVSAEAGIAPAFEQAAKSGAQAVLVLSSPIVTFHAREFAEHAMRRGFPAVFPYLDVVEAGGLMHYGVSMRDLFARAAGYVDRILRGAKPADLPVEQPSRFELVVNRAAARRMGIDVPAAVLARADRIID